MDSSYHVITLKSSDPRLDRYRNLILSTFLRSVRNGNETYALIDDKSYYKAYKLYIAQILSRPGVLIKLAVLTDDEDFALGWSLYEDTHLEFIYVKRHLRKEGIGKSLMPRDIHSFSHITMIGKSIWKWNKKYSQLKFNPFRWNLGE